MREPSPARRPVIFQAEAGVRPGPQPQRGGGLPPGGRWKPRPARPPAQGARSGPPGDAGNHGWTRVPHTRAFPRPHAQDRVPLPHQAQREAAQGGSRSRKNGIPGRSSGHRVSLSQERVVGLTLPRTTTPRDGKRPREVGNFDLSPGRKRWAASLASPRGQHHSARTSGTLLSKTRGTGDASLIIKTATQLT